MAATEFVFDIDLLDCPVCQGKIVAEVTYQPKRQSLDMPDGEEPPLISDIIKSVSFSAIPTNVFVRHECKDKPHPRGMLWSSDTTV